MSNAEAERILMDRLTLCINAGTHKRVPIHSSPFDTPIQKMRIIRYENCPRCGIGRGFTYSTVTKRVIRLL